MKKTKIIFQIIFLTIFLANCASVKRGMEGKRISKGEEFLIEKKNSLEIPPDFGELPLPRKSSDKDNISLDEDVDFGKFEIGTPVDYLIGTNDEGEKIARKVRII